jgi:hypothetical protein
MQLFFVNFFFPLFPLFFSHFIFIMTAAAENTKSHSNNNNDNKTKSREKEQVNDTKPGLLPPQALPTPPPPPPSTQDTSTLTSPWWSEESTETATIEKTIETSDNKNTSTSTTEPIASTTNSSLEKNIDATPSSATTTTTPIKTSSKTKKDKQPDSTILNISLLTFGRSSTKITPDHPWKERCFLLATTTELSPKRQKKDDNVENELEKVFDKAKECSMICFLRSSKQLTRDRLIKENNGDESKLPLTFAINPFYGTWITVVKTPKRCKEHLLQGAYSN